MPVVVEYSNHSINSDNSDTFSSSFLSFESWNWRHLKNSQIFMLKAAAIVGGGGFIYGYDIGIISGTLIQLQRRFSLSSIEQGLVVSLLPLGSIVGCLFGGPLCDYIGRWQTIIIQNLIYIGGALIIAGANNVETIYVGRFIIGIGTALSGIADIPYLTEISPPQYRGRLASAYEFLAVVGIFTSFLVNLMVSQQDGSWRFLFALPSIFAFFQGVFMIYLPDSPKWLIQNGYYDRGRFALRQALDSEEEVTNKFNEIKSSQENSISDQVQEKAYKECLYRYKWMFVCIFILMFFQQFTGGVVVRNYATSIFHSAGFSDQAALTFTVIVGFVKVLTVGWSILNLDGLGRKYLLIVGICIQGLGHLILSIGFTISASVNIGIYVIGSSLILGGFSLGLGPITWLLQSEIFPTLIRGRAMGFSVIMRNIGEFAINFTYLTIVQSIGNNGIFFMFFLLCLLALIFVYFFFVETKEKEPDEILNDFEMNFLKLFRFKTGNYYGVDDNSAHGTTSNNIIPTSITNSSLAPIPVVGRGRGHKKGSVSESVEMNPLSRRGK